MSSQRQKKVSNWGNFDGDDMNDVTLANMSQEQNSLYTCI